MGRLCRIRLVTIALAFSLLITFSVGGQTTFAASGGPTSQRTLAQRFDGETLLRGLAFAQGPVAALFPEFAQFPALSAQQIAAIDRIIARLRQTEPEFFAQFATIQDGSRPNIRGELERAGVLLHQAIRQEFGIPTNGGPSPACIDVVVFIALVVVVDIAAVVSVVIDVTAAEVVNLVVTANVVVNTNLFFAPVASGGVRLSPLARDQWIDRLARTLARA